MASGFLTLPDGRCFAKRWRYHDQVIKLVAESLPIEPDAQLLRGWLLELIPGPNDEEDLGYGPWLRVSDDQVISRDLDLRELTENNQTLFIESAKRANAQLPSNESDPTLAIAMRDLIEMIDHMERGEPPLSKSDLKVIEPSEGKRSGPGWDAR